MRTLHTVLPAAGEGRRFRDTSGVPKPLIKVAGKIMIAHAFENLDRIGALQRSTVVIRGEHDRQYNLGRQVMDVAPNANIVATDDPPQGALLDMYRARPHLDANEGVFITSCDVRLNSDAYFTAIRNSLLDRSDIDGALLLFNSDNPRYGYAEVDANNNVTETVEKRVISNLAIAGVYYMRNPGVLDDAMDLTVGNSRYENEPELAVPLAFDALTRSGAKIQGVMMENPGDFVHIGTPEELTSFLGNASIIGAD